MIRIANAPVSYGVFTPDHVKRADLPDGDQLAAWVAEAGYEGIDLGPQGLLDAGDGLVTRLQANGLQLAGGWIDLPFHTDDDAAYARARARLDAALQPFVDALAAGQTLAPLPTIADSGDDIRRAHPGGRDDLMLDDASWERFAQRLNDVTAHVRSLGLEPTFHHHACTYVETPAEIDRLLAMTDIGLTFDSGHLLIGGGEPVRDFGRWRERINHLHLKDARRSVLAGALDSDDPLQSVWEQRVFVPLGDGDLDMDNLIDAVVASGYAGWLVVEQDVIIAGADDVERANADQIANRERLRRWFA